MLRTWTTSLLALTLWSVPHRAQARPKHIHSVPAPTPAPAAEPSADGTPALRALTKIETRWQALRADAKRNRLRCNWTKLTEQFEHVAEKYPKSPEAPLALLDAAKAYEDLAHASFHEEDYQLAATEYQRVTGEYASSTSCDDAHLALAHLYRHRLHDEEKARAELVAMNKSHHGHGADASSEHPKTKAHAKTAIAEASKTEDAKVESVKAPAPKVAPAKTEVAADDFAADEPAKLPGSHLATSKPDADEVEAPKAPVVKPDPPKAEVVKAEAPKAESPKVEIAKTELAAPIVSPETINGISEGLPAHAAVESAPAAPTALFQATDIVPARSASHEGLDKGRLAALKSAVRTSGDLPLSAQMGLKVRRVVIDPGHGGHDTGAIGPTGIKEKDASLAVAKRLAEKLRLQGLDVLLTRSDDRFISLERRTAFANENRADLFVSVHCNAASDAKLRGVETYSLNLSSNQYAMRLAARENATSERSISDLQYLLADLTTKANTTDSRNLARLVQSSVTTGLREKYDPIRDLGTKEALFYVLMGTRMPSILVEGSFISNPIEEHRLNDASFQDALANSIASGVARFIDDRQSLGGTPVAGLP